MINYLISNAGKGRGGRTGMGSSNKKTRLCVGGMTCVNCQNKIEKKLRKTEGVISASVDYNHGTAEVIFDTSKLSLKDIISIIEKQGYKVIMGDESQRADMVRISCLLFSIAALYVILQKIGILNLLVPGQLADAKMGYGMLFVIGIITSVHCIAMCGGINLSQCIGQTGENNAQNRSKLDVFILALSYNFGRVLSYTGIGFVLGMIGFLLGSSAEVGISVLLQGILKIIAGVFMIVMGINMLGLFPGLRKFTIRVPGFLAKKVGKKRAVSTRPFIVGILNGFMPCGPLQSMWIVALASGNPISGALAMFLFSLGTVPLMLGFGSIVSVLGRKFTDKVMTAGAVLVVVLGLAMLSQGGSLSGWLPPDLLLVLVIAFCIAGILLSIPVRKKLLKNAVRIASLAVVAGSCFWWGFQGGSIKNYEAVGAEEKVVDGIQEINSTLTAGSYPNITVQAGVPVRWVIDAPQGSINGCNYRIFIPDYDIEYTFQTGENVIEFTPTEAGKVRYSCWMGMIRGNIYVTDGTENNVSESTDYPAEVFEGSGQSCCGI